LPRRSGVQPDVKLIRNTDWLEADGLLTLIEIIKGPIDKCSMTRIEVLNDELNSERPLSSRSFLLVTANNSEVTSYAKAE